MRTPRHRPHPVRALAAVVLLPLALGGCGAKEDDARDLSDAVVDRLNDDGACDDPPADLAATDWEPLCRAVRAALMDGRVVTLVSTTAETSGEIGYAYASVATFTGADGTQRTMRLQFVGTGFTGRTPELSYVTLDDAVLFDG